MFSIVFAKFRKMSEVLRIRKIYENGTNHHRRGIRYVMTNWPDNKGDVLGWLDVALGFPDDFR